MSEVASTKRCVCVGSSVKPSPSTAPQYAIARPYYRKVRVVAGAMAQGSQAVTEEQFTTLLQSSRSLVVAAVGFVGLGLLLWLMILKPFGTF